MVNQWIDQWILESTTCCAHRAENITTSAACSPQATPTGSPLATREAANAGDCASDILAESDSPYWASRSGVSALSLLRPSVRRSLRFR